MGRVLGGIRLSGLSFLGGILFLCKKAFYVFLRTNQFLHLVPCLAVVRVRCFLLGQQFCKLRIQLLDLRQLFHPGFVKGSFRRLVQSNLLPVSFQKLLTVPRLAVGIIDRASLGIVDNVGFQHGNLCQPCFCCLDGIAHGMIAFCRRRCSILQFVGTADLLLL